MKYKQLPKICVSEETKKKMLKYGKMGDTYEDIIKYLMSKVKPPK